MTLCSYEPILGKAKYLAQIRLKSGQYRWSDYIKHTLTALLWIQNIVLLIVLK